MSEHTHGYAEDKEALVRNAVSRALREMGP